MSYNVENPSQPTYIGDDSFESYWNTMATVGGSDNLIERIAMPGQAQKQEWSQQMVSQQYNNWYSTKGRYKDLVDLGINPNLAAAAVAGVSPSSASAPNSAIGAGAAGLDSMSNVVKTVSDVANDALNTGVDTLDKLVTLNPRRRKYLADAKLAFMNAGKTELEAEGLSISLQYLDKKEMLGIVSLTQNIENMRGQYSVMMQQIDESKKKVDEMDSQIKLFDAQRNYTDKLRVVAERNAELLQQQTIEQEFWNNLRSTYGIDPHLPIVNNLLMSGVKGNQESYNTTLQAIYDYDYKSKYGENAADYASGFQAAFAKESGKLAAGADYQEYATDLEIYKNTMTELAKSILENPDDIESVVAKWFNMLNRFAYHISTDKPQKPRERIPQP